MIECFACGAEFEVKFEDEGTKINFCPHCGQESVDQLILDENVEIDPSIFDEDEWQ